MKSSAVDSNYDPGVGEEVVGLFECADVFVSVRGLEGWYELMVGKAGGYLEFAIGLDIFECFLQLIIWLGRYLHVQKLGWFST